MASSTPMAPPPAQPVPGAPAPKKGSNALVWILAGCGGRYPRTRGHGGLGPALTSGFICPRAGHTLDEGRQLRSFEYLYAVPGVFAVGDIADPRGIGPDLRPVG